MSYVGLTYSYVGDSKSYVGLINTYAEDNNSSVGLNNTYIGHKSYVGAIHT